MPGRPKSTHSKFKRGKYEKPNLPWALTGIVDEEGRRFATFSYDDHGRATSTEHGVGVDRYSVSYTAPPTIVVTDEYDAGERVLYRSRRWQLPSSPLVSTPSGGSVGLEADLVTDHMKVTGRSQPAGSGCGVSDSALSYDARGNVKSQVDFNQVRSCHAYASDRHLETYRLEGLSKAADCPPNLADAQVGVGKRKVSTRWHPLWALESQRAEPKRITTTVYNGQKDPIKKDGTAVVCAPDAPLLPDGSMIAAVCRRYEQSTSDETGSLGFDAQVTETRKWSYTYNQYGQVLSETDPSGKLTTYEYWADTAFVGSGDAARGHWLGDLKKVTNALGQATEHLEYSKRGQVLTTKFANGSQEQREYHARGWLTKTTLVPAGGGAGQVTQYEYYDTRLLKKVTQPDGSFALYEWDAAHRLTDVSDSLGNKVHYELDNAGNRTVENFRDPQGKLAKTITRTFDALGRMQSSAGLQ